MRLVCPHCDAAYDVPPALLAGRRAVRCARCGQQWSEAPEEFDAPESDAPESDAAEPDAVPAAASPPETRFPIRLSDPAASARAHGTAIRFGWAGSVLLLALGAWSVVAWRADVMHAWPPSGRLYSALGLSGGR